MKRWRLGLVVGLLIIAPTLLSNATAQEKPLKKIYWGVSTLSPNLWIPWLAKDAKIFEKNGLDVEPVLLRGSGQTSQAMVSGSLFASSVALPAVMLADLNGADLANVAHGIAAQGSKLMVRPEIRKIEDLKGKKIGISSLGSAGDLLFGYVLRKYGIDTSREVFWLAVGNTAERLQALYSGAVDAADLTFPSDLQAERKGFRALARCEKRDRLSDSVRGDASQDDPRGSRHRDALRAILRGRHCFFEAEQRVQPEGLSQIFANHRSGVFGRRLHYIQARFHCRAVSDHQGARGHLRYRRVQKTRNPQPQTRGVRRRELCGRIGQERIYQKAIRAKVGETRPKRIDRKEPREDKIRNLRISSFANSAFLRLNS